MADKYSDKKSELRFVVPLVLGCAAAIILFHALYWKEFVVLTHDALFIILDIVGILGFAYASYRAFKLRETAKDNSTRWTVALVAAAVLIWVGAWCSEYRAKKSSNIHYEYNKK